MLGLSVLIRSRPRKRTQAGMSITLLKDQTIISDFTLFETRNWHLAESPRFFTIGLAIGWQSRYFYANRATLTLVQKILKVVFCPVLYF